MSVPQQLVLPFPIPTTWHECLEDEKAEVKAALIGPLMQFEAALVPGSTPAQMMTAATNLPLQLVANGVDLGPLALQSLLALGISKAQAALSPKPAAPAAK